MVTTNVEDIYPLSPMQQGMLLHTLQDSSGDMYLQQDVYIVDGHLDTNLLIEAWQQVFAAHPALRTSFQWDGLDQPLQVVHRNVTPPTRLDDWRGQPEEEQQQRLDELLSKDRASGFDLTVPPLQRLLVVRLDDERHALAWTHHHLLMDGWSVPLFMNEVMSQYRSLTTGGPGPAPAPPFRDYIAWLGRQDMDAARKFWSDSLGDVRRRPFAVCARWTLSDRPGNRGGASSTSQTRSRTACVRRPFGTGSRPPPFWTPRGRLYCIVTQTPPARGRVGPCQLGTFGRAARR